MSRHWLHLPSHVCAGRPHARIYLKIADRPSYIHFGSPHRVGSLADLNLELLGPAKISGAGRWAMADMRAPRLVVTNGTVSGLEEYRTLPEKMIG